MNDKEIINYIAAAVNDLLKTITEVAPEDDAKYHDILRLTGLMVNKSITRILEEHEQEKKKQN